MQHVREPERVVELGDFGHALFGANVDRLTASDERQAPQPMLAL